MKAGDYQLYIGESSEYYTKNKYYIVECVDSNNPDCCIFICDDELPRYFRAYENDPVWKSVTKNEIRKTKLERFYEKKYII